MISSRVSPRPSMMPRITSYNVCYTKLLRVDPMSLMQVNLLQRWRASDREDGELFDALLASVNGIAQGMQNTG